jgi:hypothetical protein
MPETPMDEYGQFARLVGEIGRAGEGFDVLSRADFEAFEYGRDGKFRSRVVCTNRPHNLATVRIVGAWNWIAHF